MQQFDGGKCAMLFQSKAFQKIPNKDLGELNAVGITTLFTDR
jgi:hypothetical protein